MTEMKIFRQIVPSGGDELPPSYDMDTSEEEDVPVGLPRSDETSGSSEDVYEQDVDEKVVDNARVRKQRQRPARGGAPTGTTARGGPPTGTTAAGSDRRAEGEAEESGTEFEEGEDDEEDVVGAANPPETIQGGKSKFSSSEGEDEAVAGGPGPRPRRGGSTRYSLDG
mmetsp:Transcript_13817/g.34048  ORF Transcript_13817/g.34048 Transcript_13817/m.34048 type:complete len:168 (+) Transcript_13817:1176-1679(+)